MIPFLLVLFLFGIALGIFGSAVVLRLGPASEWFVWPIPALISPFAGVFYPWRRCRRGCSRRPAAAALLCLRGHARDRRRRRASAGALLAARRSRCVYILLACAFFAASTATPIRTGLIARYSAETVS